jgi:hypothetical protein
LLRRRQRFNQGARHCCYKTEDAWVNIEASGWRFDTETEFPATPATLGINLCRNLMLSPADVDQPIKCPDENA